MTIEKTLCIQSVSLLVVLDIHWDIWIFICRGISGSQTYHTLAGEIFI